MADRPAAHGTPDLRRASAAGPGRGHRLDQGGHDPGRRGRLWRAPHTPAAVADADRRPRCPTMTDDARGRQGQ
ncbi:MAG: hypothetical protein WCA30_13175 [Dermatophilaceae bacterium]